MTPRALKPVDHLTDRELDAAIFRGVVGLVVGLVCGGLWGFVTQLVVRRGGIALTIGNLATPWVAVAALVGASMGGRVRAGLAGVATTTASVVGFYATKHVLDSVRIVPMFEVFWVAVAVVVGPLAGLLGLAFRRRESVAAALGLLPVLEVAAVYGGLRLRLTSGRLVVALVEVVVGLAFVTVALVRSGVVYLEPVDGPRDPGGAA